MCPGRHNYSIIFKNLKGSQSRCDSNGCRERQSLDLRCGKKYSHNRPVHFIGSHPMAGSEKKGMEHAYAELVENAPCIVTPDANSNPLALEKLINFGRL